MIAATKEQLQICGVVIRRGFIPSVSIEFTNTAGPISPDVRLYRQVVSAPQLAEMAAEVRRQFVELSVWTAGNAFKEAAIGQVQGSQTGLQDQSPGRENPSGGSAGPTDAQLPIHANSHLSRTRAKAKAAARTR